MNLRIKFFCGAMALVLTSLCFHQLPAANAQPALTEGFEVGGKTSYVAATVQLTSGQWYLDDALTGNLSTARLGLIERAVERSGGHRVGGRQPVTGEAWSETVRSNARQHALPPGGALLVPPENLRLVLLTLPT
jgi:hypothetical protein